MRTLLLIAPLLAATAWAEPPKVNLDRPCVLEQIQRDTPQHYRAIQEILKVPTQMPCQEHELAVLKARFGVADLDCGVLLLTSYPAQRNVHFQLAGVEYLATVTIDAQ